jgi:dynein assembly factor 1
LEGNGISVIENLDALQELRCLYLQKNCISDMSHGLEELRELAQLNLSHNSLRAIAGLTNLSNLSTLQFTHNKLETAADVAGVLQCPSISVLDISHNKLNDPEALEIFGQMPNLRVLNLMGNPIIKRTRNYRKTMINKCSQLTYLDDRPIRDQERACAEAWLEGGLEAERKTR